MTDRTIHTRFKVVLNTTPEIWSVQAIRQATRYKATGHPRALLWRTFIPVEEWERLPRTPEEALIAFKKETQDSVSSLQAKLDQRTQFNNRVQNLKMEDCVLCHGD